MQFKTSTVERKGTGTIMTASSMKEGNSHQEVADKIKEDLDRRKFSEIISATIRVSRANLEQDYDNLRSAQGFNDQEWEYETVWKK